ncbi:MAG: hypothetical protein AAF289_07145 [Cyanobacteria bacterium P01_A01_bin.135]
MATNPTPNRPRSEPPSLEGLKDQQSNLKLTVEELQAKLNRTRSFLNTLIFGLVVATFFGLGLAGWLTYRLLVQEQIAKRDLEQATISSTALEERLEGIEAELQAQERQLQNLRETLPADLELLTETVETNQRQITRLRDRLSEASAAAEEAATDAAE